MADAPRIACTRNGGRRGTAQRSAARRRERESGEARHCAARCSARSEYRETVQRAVTNPIRNSRLIIKRIPWPIVNQPASCYCTLENRTDAFGSGAPTASENIVDINHYLDVVIRKIPPCRRWMTRRGIERVARIASEIRLAPNLYVGYRFAMSLRRIRPVETSDFAESNVELAPSAR